MNKLVDIIKKKTITLDKFISTALYDKHHGYYIKKNPFSKMKIPQQPLDGF